MHATHQSHVKTLFDRPARLRGLALLILVLMILVILAGMIWRNLERQDTIHAYVTYSHRIQDSGLNLQQALMDELGGGKPRVAELRRISGQLRELIGLDSHLATETPTRLAGVAAMLDGLSDTQGQSFRAELSDALRIMHGILSTETDLRETVLEEISRDTLAELELATATLTILLLLAGFFLRERILTPLNDLRRLLLLLAEEDYTPIDTHHLDPLLLPVFNSYNLMVRRLAELEEAKRRHAESLEAEVRQATRALLEQQHSLARAERLAAVGELAASVAHELRNPLAGIQMTCTNLRNEMDDADQVARLDLVSAELQRMARLLSDLLAQGRQPPPEPVELNLATMVRELLALTRYQIAPEIALTCHIPDDLDCRLPESPLRQALLNLILNAAQAIADSRDGAIHIAAARDDGGLRIEVSDSGPGFDREMLTAGIRPFASNRAGGTGLGLAMVQRFAREAGGQVRLANREPQGALITLNLPLRGRE